MAILGYNTKDNSNNAGFDVGRMYVSKFTLATLQTMTELHGWFRGGSATATVRIVIYADTSGAPGTLLGYTSGLTLPVTVDTELLETGFSVSLSAGDYWIGFRTSGTPSAAASAGTGGTHQGKLTGAADPPDNPFGTVNTSGTRKLCCWAVVGTPASTFVPQVTIID